MIVRFDPPEEALAFAEAGGQVTLEEWSAMGDADRAALRAAREVVAKRNAVWAALAIQGRLTTGQQRERELEELRQCVEVLSNG